MYDPEIEAALTDEDQVVFTANAKYQVLDASCTYVSTRCMKIEAPTPTNFPPSAKSFI